MKKTIPLAITLSLFLGGCGVKEKIIDSPREITSTIVKGINNPADAFNYLEKHIALSTGGIRHGASTDWRGLHYTLRHGYGDPEEIAIAAAALLKDDYELKLLFVRGETNGVETGNVVYLMERNKKYGFIGSSPEKIFFGQGYDSIEELVSKWDGVTCNEYKIMSLREIKADYVHDTDNLYWEISEAYLDHPWIKLRGHQGSVEENDPTAKDESILRAI